MRASSLGFFSSILLLLSLTLGAAFVSADEASDIQAKIDAQNAQIQQLKNEISQVQGQLDTVGKQKKTLQNAVQEINLNIQRITKSITLTQTQINQKDLEISRLAGTIATTTSTIGNTRNQVGETMRELNTSDEESLLLAYLSGRTLSSYFDESAALAALRIELQNKIQTLSNLKVNLEENKSSAEGKRKELAALRANLTSQQKSLSIARDSQNQLLAETKNKESNYQALLAQKKAQEAKFESDLSSLESQLKGLVNPGSFADAGAGVLSWPLDKVRITQYFGNTDFSTANPQVYNGKGHNAIDLAASDGTPLKAALGGVVVGTGNTDSQRGCYSYGKWVLVEHPNGLSTLYAHLSVIGVEKGQTLARGQVLGYSGHTGYATGPHLHFGVYASQGVRIVQFTSSINCKNVSIPIADVSAYLNPLSYLPKL